MVQQNLARKDREIDRTIPDPLLHHANFRRTPRLLSRNPLRPVCWCRPHQDFRPLGSSIERAWIRKSYKKMSTKKVNKIQTAGADHTRRNIPGGFTTANFTRGRPYTMYAVYYLRANASQHNWSPSPHPSKVIFSCGCSSASNSSRGRFIFQLLTKLN